MNVVNYSLEDAKRIVGKGWIPLIDKLYANLHRETSVHVESIETRYGGLHVRLNEYTESLKKVVLYIELESYETCQECGKSGTVRIFGDIWRTLCDEHYDEYHTRRS